MTNEQPTNQGVPADAVIARLGQRIGVLETDLTVAHIALEQAHGTIATLAAQLAEHLDAPDAPTPAK